MRAEEDKHCPFIVSKESLQGHFKSLRILVLKDNFSLTKQYIPSNVFGEPLINLLERIFFFERLSTIHVARIKKKINRISQVNLIYNDFILKTYSYFSNWNSMNKC